MKKIGVLLARLCRGHWERSEVGTWLADAYCQLAGGKLGAVEFMAHALIDGEPTPAARNSAVVAARQAGCDVLVMIDNDMVPSPTFLGHALEFLARRPGESVVIGSPYCGAPPGRLVQVIAASDGQRCERRQAAGQRGDRIVWCIGTGLLACNMAAFETAPLPWFDYEYTSPEQHTTATTEDFFFTRRLSAAGGRVYAAWDHWSGHAKTEIVGRPE